MNLIDTTPYNRHWARQDANIIVRVKGTDPDHQGRNQMWLRLECGHTTVRRDRWVIEGKSRARCSDCQYEGS